VIERLQAYPELANRALGGAVVWSNDEFYGDADQLLVPAAPVHDPLEFDNRGKVYDGWETRRRRESGVDSAIIRLATPAVVRVVDIDTSFFRGNYPPHASVEGTALLGYPTPDELQAADWFTLVEKTDISGDASNVHDATGPERLATHVRAHHLPRRRRGPATRLRRRDARPPLPRWPDRPRVDRARRAGRGLQQHVLQLPRQRAGARPGSRDVGRLGDLEAPRRR